MSKTKYLSSALIMTLIEKRWTTIRVLTSSRDKGGSIGTGTTRFTTVFQHPPRVGLTFSSNYINSTLDVVTKLVNAWSCKNQNYIWRLLYVHSSCMAHPSPVGVHVCMCMRLCTYVCMFMHVCMYVCIYVCTFI